MDWLETLAFLAVDGGEFGALLTVGLKVLLGGAHKLDGDELEAGSLSVFCFGGSG